MEETREYRKAYPEEIVKDAIFYLRRSENNTLPYAVYNNRYGVLGISEISPILVTISNLSSVHGNPITVTRDRLLKHNLGKSRLITIDINF